MRAVTLDSFDAAPAMRDDLPNPTTAADGLVVRVRASSINPVDDRLGRGLERFACHAEAVRGALAARAIERFGVDAGRLHVDLTALRMTGAYEESSLVARGLSPRAGRRPPGAGAAGPLRRWRLALPASRAGR